MNYNTLRQMAKAMQAKNQTAEVRPEELEKLK